MIVLFHRVSIAYPNDPIGISRKRFRKFCRVFKKAFTVVSLGELLQELAESPCRVGGKLVLTFDDGYLDNYECAMPELRECGLPATFFVATGYVGSERNAPWDADAGVEAEWMTWDHVRELSELGFEIGSHTVNHVNLGTLELAKQLGGTELPSHWHANVSDEVAVQELVSSKERLEQELGVSVSLFSFPFGRRENLSERNRERIRDAGFECCASAYGGVVTCQTDRYFLERIPINDWFRSPYQFVFHAIVAQRKGAKSWNEV